MLEVSHIGKPYDGEVDVTFTVKVKAEIEVEIENGEWVSDEPIGDWFYPDDIDLGYAGYHDVWETGPNAEIANAYVMDGDTLYEDICEDLINLPELTTLPDGKYIISCDATADVLLEGVYVNDEVGYEYERETDTSYPVDYETYDASDANHRTLRITTDNINIERL